MNMNELKCWNESERTPDWITHVQRDLRLVELLQAWFWGTLAAAIVTFALVQAGLFFV